MALINCPECNDKISKEAQICPTCGIELTAEKIQNSEKEGFFEKIERENEKNATTCKSCKGITPKNTKVCPHCGEKDPTGQRKSRIGCLVISIIVALTIALLLIPEPEKPMKVFSVSDYSYTSKGIQVVSIIVGIDKMNYFRFNIPRSKVTKGLTGTSSGSASWDGKSYISSSKFPTSVKYSIDEFNKTTKKATISVNVKLVNSKTLSDYLEKKASIIITGVLFENLTKDI